VTCRELIDALADLLAGAPAADLAGALERHLAGCGACRAYLATYRATRALAVAAARVEMPDAMRARLGAVLADRLRGA
jgi:anti-sigma factor RsiW